MLLARDALVSGFQHMPSVFICLLKVYPSQVWPQEGQSLQSLCVPYEQLNDSLEDRIRRTRT